MKKLFLALFVWSLIWITNSYSQSSVYPKNIDWSKAGAVTDFPTPAEVNNVFNVSYPDSGFDQSNIQAAIDSAGLADGINVVQLRRGIYNLSRPLILEAGRHDNVYVKGAGPNHQMHSGPYTILKFNFSNPDDFKIPVYGGMNAAIALRGGGGTFLGTISEFDRSKNQIKITGSSQKISTGDLLRIRSNREGVSCKVHPCMGQINRVKTVVDISPLVLELEHNFSLTWEQQQEYGGLNLNVHKIDALENIGISSVGIETTGYKEQSFPEHFACKDQPEAANSPHAHHILAFRVYNALIDEVYSFRPIAHHIYMIESLNKTISESFFDDAIYRHGCNGGHGYGVNLFRKNTLNLVENNVFRHLRRSLMFNRGAHKNVIGYNYSRELAAQTGSENRGDLSSRNMSDSGNLAEGNVLDRIINDTYHEKKFTAYKNVYFRNYTHYNYLENEGGIENYFIGNRGDFSGNHEPSSVETDLHGFIGQEALTHNDDPSEFETRLTLNESSLYYKTAPDFLSQLNEWNSNYTWPLIGPRLNRRTPFPVQRIPTWDRYCDAYDDYFDSEYHCSR